MSEVFTLIAPNLHLSLTAEFTKTPEKKLCDLSALGAGEYGRLCRNQGQKAKNLRKKRRFTGFCDCKGSLRLTAQEQAQAEKALEVTTNYTNFAHKADYMKKENNCKSFSS
ncbi:MAG: hypothetical protein AMJ75_03315 [Phycisphaerae bacterium SM1_79]|nr:MAG: hypothetical protein AMJ75_03315 [Phycisphaerae bacterium SM1_79]